MRTTFLSSLLLLLFGSLVLRWEMTQVYAWANMLAERSAEGGIAEAVESTFSGEAPCGLCHQITRGRTETEDDSSYQAPIPPGPEWLHLPLAALAPVNPSPHAYPGAPVCLYENPGFPSEAPPPRTLLLS